MDKELEALLQQHTPIAEETAIWGNGTVHLHITNYLSDTLPPLNYVTSVRAIVLQEENVLVVRDHVGPHIEPGGRREAGETLLQTLQRELLEETGWTIEDVQLLGFKHLHHLKPVPEDYSYITPDFFQVIYTARADTYRAEAVRTDDIEIEAFFYPIAEVQALKLKPAELLYLEAAQRIQEQE
ncbi:MAG: NUDIX hydrolase [Ktedonobacteraceae bacterium]|nr:NUDIX hydrolase [Ktedonobacteraceae bacterium]